MKVELLNYFGSDDMVASCARVSYNKEASNYSKESNAKLLKYLAEHNHTAPFFHPQLQFRVECPIYIERQIFKTAVGVSVNSISARYVDFSDSYTTIREWRQQSKTSKQGSEGAIEEQQKADIIQDQVVETCKKSYQDLIDLGVSKEQARTILPLNLNTQFIWTGSLFAFIRLCTLRLKEDAQQETREVVQLMLDEVSKTGVFEESLKVWKLPTNS